MAKSPRIYYSKLKNALKRGYRILMDTDQDNYTEDAIDLIYYVTQDLKKKLIVISFDINTKYIAETLKITRKADVSNLYFIDAMSFTKAKRTPPVTNLITVFKPDNFTDIEVYTYQWLEKLGFENCCVFFFALNKLDEYLSWDEMGVFLKTYGDWLEKYNVPEIIIMHSKISYTLIQIFSRNAQERISVRAKPILKTDQEPKPKILDKKSKKIKLLLVEDIMTKNLVIIDSTAPVSSVLTKLFSTIVGSIIVSENNIPIGIITEMDIIRNYYLHSDSILQFPARKIMSSPLQAIDSKELLSTVINRFNQFNIKKMPVSVNGKHMGIITLTDIVNNLQTLFPNTLKKILVKDIISPKLFTVDINQKVIKVVKVMVENKIGSVTLVENNEPSAILTKRDIILNWVKKQVMETPAIDIASKHLITLNENNTISEAASLMKNEHIKKIMVRRKGKIVGTITQTDIIRNIDKFFER